MRWCEIPDFPNYEVSDHGMVRRVSGSLRKLSLHRSGYLQVQLRNERGPKTFLVHRLVAWAFVHGAAGCDVVDHIDSDKTNNAHTNLRWTDLTTNSQPGRPRGKTSSERPVPAPDAVWKPIPGFEVYEASSCGLIRRREICEGSQGLPLRMWQSASGYSQVALCLDGKKSTLHVHTLVALAFHGVRPEGHVIDHVDRCKTNNAAFNLEYVTRGMNASRFESTLRQTRRGEHKRKLTVSDVSTIKLRIAAGESLKSIRRDYAVAPHTLSNIKTGRTWRDVA